MQYMITQKVTDFVPNLPFEKAGNGARLQDVLNSGTGIVLLLILYWVFALALVVVVSIAFRSWVVCAIIGVVVSGVCVVLFLPRIRTMTALFPGELLLERWPLRRNEKVRIRYQRKLKAAMSITGVEAILTCCERATRKVHSPTLGSDHASSTTLTDENLLFERKLDQPKQKLSDEKLVCDWLIRLPERYPPTLELRPIQIRWEIKVVVTADNLPVSVSRFPILVGAEVVV